MSLKALGEKNPYRYRGYRYDTETGYYYLQSRYYNPEWGRFLNIDAIGGNVGALLSHNIFAYCNNNPVISKDPNGFRPMYTQGEETAAMRDASYKVMAKATSAKAKSNSIGIYDVYKTHKIDADIANAGLGYGPTGFMAYTGVNTKCMSLDPWNIQQIQFYMGGSADAGLMVYKDNNNWNWMNLGLSYEPLKVGLNYRVEIFSFNAEFQVGFGAGIGGSGQLGVMAESDMTGIGMGGEFFKILGLETSLKVWIKH